MAKKIAIITERAEVTLGGAERSVFELSSALSAMGMDVTILAAKGPTETTNIRILCGDGAGKRTDYSVFARALKDHLLQNHYDVVHSVLPFDFADIYQPRGGSYMEAMLRNAASCQNKFIESCKRLTSFANLRRLRFLRAERKLCEKPDGPIVLALSQYVADQFRRHYDLNPNRIRIIPNGVKTASHIDSTEAYRLRSQILTRLRLKEADHPLLFLFAANNFRLKGLGCLIRAIAAMGNNKPPVHLIVAGRDSSLKYRCIAKKLAVDNRIVFLGSVRHIQNLLSISDVAVLPTFYDPSSRFILEALAAAKPVITTKFNGACDLFVDTRHGMIIDCPDNIDALTKAIIHFADQNNIQKAKENILSDKLADKVSIDRAAREVDNLYDQILNQGKGLCT